MCLTRWSIHSSFVNLSSSPEIITKHFLPNTRLVWLESPSNPSLRLVDINKICSIVHAYDSSIIVIVDNTFSSPLNQSPLLLSADFCLSSLTKYINGHTDVIRGCLSMNRKDSYEKFLSTKSLFNMPLLPIGCGSEALIESSALMTHRSTIHANETNQDMSEKLIPISVGLENIRDIFKDSDRALYRSINQEKSNDYNEDWELIQEAKYISNRSNALTASALYTKSGIGGGASSISSMINDGHQDLSTIVILRGFDDNKNYFELLNPCKKCRELIQDINPNTQIIVGTIDKPYRIDITDL